MPTIGTDYAGLATPHSDEEANTDAGAAPPRRSYRKGALLLAGGVAACVALATLGQGHGSPGGVLPSAKTTDIAAAIGMEDDSADASKDSADKGKVGRSKPASFLTNSKPYKPGLELLPNETMPLIIDEDGKLNKYYLPGATIVDGGKTVKYTPPYRFYLMKTPTTDYSNVDKFYRPIFPGKTFTVDITLTNVGCGCNVNFYLVNMPAATPGQDNDYYCDAQCFPNMGCCAEFDMNEGNDNVQQITNHACTGNYPDHPDWKCNKWGDPEDKSTMSMFQNGPGGKIDGSKPFTFAQEFLVTDGQLTVTTTITQGDVEVQMSMGNNPQLQSMLTDGSLEVGMVFVTGYWTAPDMNWLDGDECGAGPESCSGAPAYISNWRITTIDPKKSTTKSPTTTKSAGPGQGQCCWSTCGNCENDPNNYCSTETTCVNNCNGKWLQCPSDDDDDKDEKGAKSEAPASADAKKDAEGAKGEAAASADAKKEAGEAATPKDSEDKGKDEEGKAAEGEDAAKTAAASASS